MKTFTKDTFKKILFEFFSMVVAVLIALMANSWWLNSINENNADEATELMNKEIVENYIKSKKLLPKIVVRQKKLHAIEDEITNKLGFDSYVWKFNGFEIDQYKQTAWDRLTKSEFSGYVNYEYKNKVFELQGDIEKMKMLWGKITNLITSDLFYEPQKAKSAYKISKYLIREEINWLKLMNNNYEKFILDYMPEKAEELGILNQS